MFFIIKILCSMHFVKMTLKKSVPAPDICGGLEPDKTCYCFFDVVKFTIYKQYVLFDICNM